MQNSRGPDGLRSSWGDGPRLRKAQKAVCGGAQINQAWRIPHELDRTHKGGGLGF